MSAGRLLWPIIGKLTRLGVGGWWALQAAALVVYGLVDAAAIARGTWLR